jgi:mono/diheme cytochrome c family protein
VMITGLSARPAPGALETRVMRTVRRLAIPRDVRSRTNPAPADAATLDEAMAHFADHCATCHANDGSGNVSIGQGLYPKAPDMRLPATQTLTDGELFYTIEHGIRFTGMPAFGDGSAEGEAASWALVRFIRELPALDAGRLERMKAMNPRPPAEIRREIEEEQFLEGR